MLLRCFDVTSWHACHPDCGFDRKGRPIPTQDDGAFLRRAIAVSAAVCAKDNHPFGAVLVGPDGKVLLEAENTVVTERDATGHAERNLMTLASRRFSRDLLACCTLYTSTEPCAMCSGQSTEPASAG
jgi:tRNA(Arg) A34 adenosine deaminase TadA